MCIHKDVKAAISRLSDDCISKVVPYLPYRAEFVKTFRSQLSVFSETSKSVPLSSSDDDQLSEKNIRKLVTAIKGSDLLP